MHGFVDDEFAVGFAASGLGLEAIASAQRESSYLVVFGIFGELPIERDGQRLRVTRSVAAVVNPGERLVVRPGGGPAGMLVVRLYRRLVRRELTALLGREPGTDPRFTLALDLAQPTGPGIRDLVHGLLGRPAVREAEVRSLVTSLLLAHRHTHSGLLPEDFGPRYLARAVEYIEAHLAERITLGDLAQAAGRSARTVDAAFREHLGVSPMTHVRNLRLDRVRAALPASRQKTGVIALNAGFTHLGRFAAAYRERFGELPSATRRTTLR
ncbi:helix-turn-helix transcriptional regulator [Amycolatopsis balhimycina]|uniref:helix-turn-helix transcriptional regulator n=1 Tax=Amycolatopsis balhimycina TaxID=208443 RepID=UPI0003663F0D|nr:AraC family transcriptional regulator [Amycolatopsis balhimycina]